MNNIQELVSSSRTNLLTSPIGSLNREDLPRLEQLARQVGWQEKNLLAFSLQLAESVRLAFVPNTNPNNKQPYLSERLLQDFAQKIEGAGPLDLLKHPAFLYDFVMHLINLGISLHSNTVVRVARKPITNLTEFFHSKGTNFRDYTQLELKFLSRLVDPNTMSFYQFINNRHALISLVNSIAKEVGTIKWNTQEWGTELLTLEKRRYGKMYIESGATDFVGSDDLKTLFRILSGLGGRFNENPNRAVALNEIYARYFSQSLSAEEVAEVLRRPYPFILTQMPVGNGQMYESAHVMYLTPSREGSVARIIGQDARTNRPFTQVADLEIADTEKLGSLFSRGFQPLISLYAQAPPVGIKYPQSRLGISSGMTASSPMLVQEDEIPPTGSMSEESQVIVADGIPQFDAAKLNVTQLGKLDKNKLAKMLTQLVKFSLDSSEKTYLDRTLLYTGTHEGPSIMMERFVVLLDLLNILTAKYFQVNNVKLDPTDPRSRRKTFVRATTAPEIFTEKYFDLALIDQQSGLGPLSRKIITEQSLEQSGSSQLEQTILGVLDGRTTISSAQDMISRL